MKRCTALLGKPINVMAKERYKESSEVAGSAAVVALGVESQRAVEKAAELLSALLLEGGEKLQGSKKIVINGCTIEFSARITKVSMFGDT